MIKNDNRKYNKIAHEKVANGFYCDSCRYGCVRKYNFEKHLLTPSHNSQILQVSNILEDKIVKLYTCIICDYSTPYKCNFNKHNLTASHTKVSKKIVDNIPLKNVCICGKEYKFTSGLARHKLVCNNQQQPKTSDVIELIKENKEFKEMLVEQHKQLIALACEKTTIINNNTQNNNTQNNNMTFNLNTFLNEKCKDAINLTDFINSMQVSFEDLENTGKNGIVKSLSQCIARELGKLDVYSRPIHCSDSKRKVIHIKNENEWQRDADEHPATKRMLSKINHTMNVSQVLKWKDTYPSCELSNDKRNTLYLKIVRNMVEGEDETYEKVIAQISENIVIDKGAQKHMMLTN